MNMADHTSPPLIGAQPVVPVNRVRASRLAGAVTWRLIIGAILTFLYLPIIVLVLFSFNASRSLSWPMSGLGAVCVGLKVKVCFAQEPGFAKLGRKRPPERRDRPLAFIGRSHNAAVQRPQNRP
ncbi:hypothetical protein I5535_06965 [Rhodobacteraceae bacterium F11138]|nr:hypothetical protein [Rhodobacteraceae bacterium F11138]